MSIPIILSSIALFISAITATVTVLNLIKDRSRVIAWSEVILDSIDPKAGPTPVLFIKIVNAGRRPIVITSVEKISKQLTWNTPLKSPDMEEIGMSVNEVIFKPELRRKVFSQGNTSVVLNEADYFELCYADNYFLGEVSSFIEGEPLQAYSMVITDVLGSKYPIKNIEKNIKYMLEYDKA